MFSEPHQKPVLPFNKKLLFVFATAGTDLSAIPTASAGRLHASGNEFRNSPVLLFAHSTTGIVSVDLPR